MPVLHFEVHGDFTTQHFRDRVIEGAWGDALTGLQQSLQGMTYEQAIKILSGKAKLEGVNEMKMLDDDDAEYIEEVNAQYGHTLWFQGHFWTPYAYVGSYGQADKGDPDVTDRALHYADYKFQDITFKCQIPSNPGTTAVLFKMTQMPPIWMPKQTDPQKCVDAFLEGYRTLEERGHSIRYEMGGIDDPVDIDPPVHTQSLEYANRMEHRISMLKETDNFRPEDHIDEILKQNEEHCGGRMHEFDFGGSVGKVKIPEGPLHCWALRRTHAHRIPYPWEPVSPRGLRMMGDDPFHTDWMVGAGIPLEAYSQQEDFQDKGFELMQELQAKLLGFDVTVLVAGKPRAFGEIKHWKPDTTYTKDDIVVVPHAGEKFYEVAKQASALICCQGGKMSHLAVIGLEENMLIIRETSALIKFPQGTLLEIIADTGKIQISAHRALSMAEILGV